MLRPSPSLALTTLLMLPAPTLGDEAGAIAEVLDALHAAAAAADGESYFALFSADAVFFGTDPEERWTLEQFRDYARPFFSQGRGWTYGVRERHVILGPGGHVAWFDEALANERYGDCRGTGVVVLVDGAWKIAQYNLSIPIPNDLALTVVDMIRDPD